MTGNSLHNTGNLEIASSEQDILANKKHKTKRWIIAALILILVIGLVVGALALLNKDTNKPAHFPLVTSGSPLSLEDFLYGKFFANKFNATWVSDKELMYMDAKNNLVLLNIEAYLNSSNNAIKILLHSSDQITSRLSEPILSPDGKYLLVAQTYAQLYRHSKLSHYIVINIENGMRIPITVEDSPILLLAQWAPTGYGLILNYKNNLYYKKDPRSPEIKITNDGEGIYNGVPDWVYEEEVFSSNQAVWFSPDGKRIAFAKFDDRNVSVMLLPYYGEPGSNYSQYPLQNGVKYPKAGTANPLVSLHAVSLEDPTKIISLEAPANLISREPILSAVSWVNNSSVSAIWLNRVQNESFFVAYDTEEPFSSVILSHFEEPKGWLELFVPLKFNKKGTEFIIIISQDQGGNAGGYRHIALFNLTKNAVAKPLTKGKFVVTEILDWNEVDNIIYYEANTEEDPSVKHIYSVSAINGAIKCISCKLKGTRHRSECLYNTATFSKDFSYYAIGCDGPDVPEVLIFSKDGKQSISWEVNEELLEYTASKDMPIIQHLQFNISDGFVAKVTLQLPRKLDMSGGTKYPMLINVYGGPDSYQVTQDFKLNWGSYLASNKSIIYGVIDGRGSGLKGDKYLFSGYRQLGTVEIEDQIFVTKKLQEILPFVDASRTAIWGWSYGGYAAGMALATETEGVFKCGISVAPVTDWALYDTIYTERFMGLPTKEDNLKNYTNAQLLSKYKGLKNKLYYLIHGTYDDNVHFQQSMLWAKVLEQHDIFFRQTTYSDQAHDLGSVRPHLYHSLENFLDECFLDD